MREPTLYTLGYLAAHAEETLQALVAQGTLIADIRYNPTSRLPQWRQRALSARFGTSYRHIKALGNLNYKTKGLITLYAPEEGICEVVSLLAEGQSLTLLCACRDAEHCHRTLVAMMIEERLPEVPIRHLPLSRQMPEHMIWRQTQARWESGHGTNHH